VFRQLLGDEWKTRFTGIPYKGGSNVTAIGLMSGEIDLSKGSLGSYIAGINGGKVRLLAVGAKNRVSRFSEVPTFAEAGLPAHGLVFMGLVMPAGTPDAIINRLNAEAVKALGDGKVLEALASRFMEPDPMSVAEFAAFLKKDRELNGELIRRYHVPHR
jgi:tripartite-type tricarboxylate transporter receptor subunit TctC